MSPAPRRRPPAWARLLVIAVAPRNERSAVDGDLTESFGRRVLRDGLWPARRWYVAQALRSLVPLGLASLGDVSPRRWIAGALLGIALTSFAPAIADSLLRPSGLMPLETTVWYLALGGVAALVGGYASVRVSGVDAALPLVGLVWMLYAPAVLHVVGGGAAAGEVAGLVWVLVATATGGGLSVRALPG